MSTLARAREIALIAHSGQMDKTGAPYFWHCRRVAAAAVTDEEKITAYLHDVLEKGRDWNLERLRGEGFPPSVIEAVRALTREPGEDEDAYLRRAMKNEIARVVKKADLADNLRQARESGQSPEKYEKALAEIGR